MSDSEYTESLDAGQEESEENDPRRQLQHLQYQQQPQIPFMDYAGSTSSSGSSSVSSTSSSGESDGEQDSEDSWELTKITDDVLNLPRGLCENPSIFHEFFSLVTWQELPQAMKNHLQQFLPDFGQASIPPQLAAVERARTLSMLFNCSLHRFQQSPLVQLQQQLEAGNYRPDIRKLKENILKSQQRERKFQHCERLSQMAKQLFLSRQRLLDHAHKSLPDVVTKAPAPPTATTTMSTGNRRHPKPLNLYRDNKLSAIRARKRFFSEISHLNHELGITENLVLSADEDDDDRLLNEDMKRDLLAQQRSVDEQNEAVAAKANIPLAERCVYSTLFRKRSEVDDESAFRLQQKNHQTRLTNSNFKEYLRDHKRRKLTEPTLPEFETSDIRLRDVCGRAQMGGNFKRVFGTGKTPGRKPKVTPSSSSAAATASIPASTMTSQEQHSLPAKHVPPITTAPPPPPPPAPPKLSEPPALVPIQSMIKKSDAYHQHITASIQTPPTTPHNDHHLPPQQQLQSPLEMSSSFHKASNNNHNNASDALNISAFMSAHSDNLNLCMDDSSLLTADHDAFNMLDSEVELQQEEVETFAGSSDDNLTNFVIGDDIVLGSRNDSASSLLQTPHKIDPSKRTSSIIPQPLPKLEPIMRHSELAAKHSSKASNIPKSSSTSLPMGVNCSSELIQETHACYFSLIRDFFCSTLNHRMRYDDLKSKIDTWLRNPITALNEWYALADNWSNLLRSAINFLVGDFPDMGDEYVPFIEHKVQLNIYQWIGAGRDSDTRLMDLCNIWMERRKQPIEQQQQSLYQQQLPSQQLLLETKLDVLPKSAVENDEATAENGNVNLPPAPPPRCPTTWTVRAASIEEIDEFQRQERERFEQPHKAYTYRMYGYESVVAPVKGIYTPMLALSKPRGHSMMVEDRPNFVTILTLVRDATARLPNGEGTRADISELLKCSQYINQDAAENVLQTIVSGALDRMHTEHDPCVRYDPKKKIWIYLHRNRSEEEFERIHQQNHNTGKPKKLTQQRKPRPAVGAAGMNPKLNSPDVETASNTVHSMESANGSLLTLPALVPANPIIVSNNSVSRPQPPPQQHQIQLTKCPPMPPLKYNIPQNSQQQQQKSLLKSTIRQESKISPPTVTTQINKQHTFQMPIHKSNSTSNTTPIIVATPQGLQTVHVSNATSVVAASTNSNNSSQQQHQSNVSSVQQSNLTANLAGKRVMLNKPIVINQVTNQQQIQHSANNSPAVTTKLKSPQQIVKQQHGRIHTLSPQQQQQMQQLQSNVITIPISMANNLNINASTSPADHHLPTERSNPQQQQQQHAPAQSSSINPANKQNIIRIVPASNVKTVLGSPSGQQIVHRQRIISSSNLAGTERSSTVLHQQQQQQLKTNSNQGGGIHQLISSSGGNVVSVNAASGGATLSTASGSIVKMSPQAFATLQQKQAAAAVAQQQQVSKQQQQQQHIIVKQGAVTGSGKTQLQTITSMKPQRVILGNTAVMAQSAQGKNIVFQQIPAPSSSSVVVAPTTTTTTTISGNKIQTINTTNLTPQQQRILIQNLKQQQQQSQAINQNQIQFKTVQVVGSQNNVIQRPQTITVAATATTPKAMVVVSQDNGGATQQQQHTNVTRILKTTSTQLKSETPTSSAGTRVISSSSGQIISLDSLIQKQGGSLRITGSGNAGGLKTNVNQKVTAALLQKSQQQQQQQLPKQQSQQFAIVSVPNSIISLGSSNNFTVGQRIVNTQATGTVNTTMVNIDGTRVTPAVVSTAQRRIVTTPTGTKIVTKAAAGAGTTAGNIRVLNTLTQTGGINLATLQGKQVVLTSGKTVTAINKAQMQNQQQSNIVQTATAAGGSIVIGGQTIKLQQGSANIQQILGKGGNILTSQPAATGQTGGTGQMQTVIMGNQILRVQQMPQIVTAAGNRLTTNKIANSSDGTVVTSSVPKTIFVGATGQTLRLQPASSISQTTNKNIIVNANQQNIATLKTATNNSSSTVTGSATTPNRVVLAVQGGGQIFLSPNFQSGNINLKSLQNLKMVSLAQTKDHHHTASSSTSSSSPQSSSVNILSTAASSHQSNTTSDGNL